ncbi:hypothetical protein [Pseudoalteromonas sp. GB43]
MLRQIVLLVVASVMLIACSEQTSAFKTFSEGQQALQTINNLLSTQEQQSEAAS